MGRGDLYRIKNSGKKQLFIPQAKNQMTQFTLNRRFRVWTFFGGG